MVSWPLRANARASSRDRRCAVDRARHGGTGGVGNLVHVAGVCEPALILGFSVYGIRRTGAPEAVVDGRLALGPGPARLK